MPEIKDLIQKSITEFWSSETEVAFPVKPNNEEEFIRTLIKEYERMRKGRNLFRRLYAGTGQFTRAEMEKYE